MATTTGKELSAPQANGRSEATNIFPQQYGAAGDESMTRLETTVSMLEREKDELIEMVHAHEINNHSMRVQLQETQVDLQKAREELDAAESEIKRVQSKFERESDELDISATTLKKERVQHDLLKDKVHALITRNVKQAEAMSGELDEAKDELQKLNEEKERLRGTLASERKKTGQETARVGKLKQELALKTSELQKSQEVVTSLQQQLDVAKKDKVHAEAKLSQAAKEKSHVRAQLEARCKELEGGSTKLQARLNGSLRKITELQDALAEAKRDAAVAKEELNDQISDALFANSEIQEALDAAMSDAAAANGQSAATVEELNSHLKEALTEKDALEKELATIKEAVAVDASAVDASAVDAAEPTKDVIDRAKRTEKRRCGYVKKKATKMLANAGVPPIPDNAVTHLTVTHLAERLAEANNEANAYKTRNRHLMAQIDDGSHGGSDKDSTPSDALRVQKSNVGRLRSASDPLCIVDVETKNERIAELEAKNAELEAAQEDTPDIAGVGSLNIYPFELRKIQTLKADLQRMTEARNDLEARIQKCEKEHKTDVHRAGYVKQLKKEVGALTRRMHGAKNTIAELDNELDATKAKVYSL